MIGLGMLFEIGRRMALAERMGVLSLSQMYGIGRLEAACAHALKHGAVSWGSVQAILKNGLDLQQQDTQRMLDLPEHESARRCRLSTRRDQVDTYDSQGSIRDQWQRCEFARRQVFHVGRDFTSERKAHCRYREIPSFAQQRDRTVHKASHHTRHPPPQCMEHSADNSVQKRNK